MAEDERTLRGLYGLRTATPEGHLGEDDWLALASGERPARGREDAIDHVVRCAMCAHIYRGLSELEEGARHFDRRVPQAMGPAPLDALGTTRWGWWASLAAAAVLVWAIGQPRPALAPAPSATGSDLRGPTQTRPALLEPVGTVTRWPTRLRWDPVAQARGYRVKVLDGEGDLLWASPVTTETTLPWPAEVTPSAGRIYWQVTAYPQGGTDADGVDSRLVRFEYQP
ncbi:MAG TPA: hypothetical protein VFQ51_15615 [Vicinamibacteria bacterium]|nr:hypothetical protein [Vicinamibacteria bacterium]